VGDVPDSPGQVIMAALDGFMITQTVVAAARLGVVGAVVEHPRTTGELASITTTRPQQVARLLAALEGVGIVRREQVDGAERWSLPAAADPQGGASVESLVAYAELIDSVYYPAWSRLTESLRSGESAVRLAFGKSLWEMMGAEPAISESFAAMMRNNNDKSAKRLFELYEFPSQGTVVDLGGGDATFACQLLGRMPNLTATVVESASQLGHCQDTVDEHGLRDRCTCVAGDFLRSVPANGDVYILRSVLHNWPDADAVRILENCANVMAANSTLLVIERVKAAGQSSSDEAMRDLTMLALFGSEDRSFDQYARLLRSAGLRVADHRPDPHGPSVIAARRS
jgi:hypothetical protein